MVQTKKQTKTTTGNLHEIVTLLPSLSAPELMELDTRIKALLMLRKGRTSGTIPQMGGDNVDIILRAIMDVLAKRKTPAVFGMLKSSATASFREKCNMLDQYLEVAAPDKTQRLAILRVGIELLCDHIHDMGLVVAGGMIMRLIHRIPAVIDRHFPGYAQSGHLSMLIKGNKHGN